MEHYCVPSVQILLDENKEEKCISWNCKDCDKFYNKVQYFYKLIFNTMEDIQKLTLDKEGFEFYIKKYNEKYNKRDQETFTDKWLTSLLGAFKDSDGNPYNEKEILGALNTLKATAIGNYVLTSPDEKIMVQGLKKFLIEQRKLLQTDILK